MPAADFDIRRRFGRGVDGRAAAIRFRRGRSGRSGLGQRAILVVERVDGRVEIGALFVPRRFAEGEARIASAHALKIRAVPMRFVAQEGFDVHAPGVLRHEAEAAAECGALRRQAFLFETIVEPLQFEETRHFLRIRADAVNPRIADLLVDQRKAFAQRPDRLGEGIERRRADIGIGMLVKQIAVTVDRLADTLRADVVVGVRETQGEIGAFDEACRAITLLIDDENFLAARRAPAEQVGHVGRRRRRVHADVQEFHPRAREQRHTAECVAGHVGHFRRDRFHAEAAVEFLRVRQSRAEQGRRHQFGVRRERQRVPADQAVFDRAFEPAHALGRLRFEVIPDQPGAGGPDEQALLRIFAQEMLARVERAGNENLVVLPPHPFGELGEADIEMRLEDEVDGRRGHGGSIFGIYIPNISILQCKLQ